MWARSRWDRPGSGLLTRCRAGEARRCFQGHGATRISDPNSRRSSRADRTWKQASGGRWRAKRFEASRRTQACVRRPARGKAQGRIGRSRRNEKAGAARLAGGHIPEAELNVLDRPSPERSQWVRERSSSSRRDRTAITRPHSPVGMDVRSTAGGNRNVETRFDPHAGSRLRRVEPHERRRETDPSRPGHGTAGRGLLKMTPLIAAAIDDFRPQRHPRLG